MVQEPLKDEDMEVTDFPALESSNRNPLETAQPELSIRPNYPKTTYQRLKNYLEQKDNEEYETTTNENVQKKDLEREDTVIIVKNYLNHEEVRTGHLSHRKAEAKYNIPRRTIYNERKTPQADWKTTCV
ncbi:unnamed protein product [Ceutorhynchus assimilis]|uniref:HTH psq-type domain-containing protein n=1 Tax=Ceutorhynchus assimilis TaxID=467358 RepID=A0A9N9QR80_9CUCU|nr:unnamed protein product [Ceutorhynchus assimilis]